MGRIDKAEHCDRLHMRHALALARRGLGRVWPNPAVGCVLVKDGTVIGRGWTAPGGRPHAESRALEQAGRSAEGATAYVSLEPCAHHGKTPPCAEALARAGISRAVIAVNDPDPRVAGAGIQMLEDAKIPVVRDVLRDEAVEVNAGFFLKVTEKRPLVTAKFATSLDGRVATAGGQSKWITGPAARRFGHWLRANHDAILIGVETALADDPSLTCRLDGLEAHSPVRIVLDRRGRLPGDSALVQSAEQVPTWIVTESSMAAPGAADVIKVADCGDLTDILSALAGRGITRLLVEGGGRVHASFLKSGLVDRLAWFRAATVIGADGLAAAGPLGVDHLDQALKYRRADIRLFGDDVLETYVRTA